MHCEQNRRGSSLLKHRTFPERQSRLGGTLFVLFSCLMLRSGQAGVPVLRSMAALTPDRLPPLLQLPCAPYPLMPPNMKPAVPFSGRARGGSLSGE